MQNSNTPMTHEIPLVSTLSYFILATYKTNKKLTQVIMSKISKEEEDEIDKLRDRTITLERGNRTFIVSAKQIYCYGEVDFNSQKDLDTIDTFKFLGHLGGVGIHINSNYNYDTHSCSSPKSVPLWAETWIPSFLARYAHGHIGKPKRIILFNQ